MSIDLEAINRRYEAALEARPAKGEWTSVQAAILADSVADVKPLMEALEKRRGTATEEIMPMRLYLSGPMTGLPDFNREEFRHAKATLQELGFAVTSPADTRLHDGADWGDYMRVGMRSLTRVDGVALLPGWKNSFGASAEVEVAELLDIPCRTVDEWASTARIAKAIKGGVE